MQQITFFVSLSLCTLVAAGALEVEEEEGGREGRHERGKKRKRRREKEKEKKRKASVIVALMGKREERSETCSS